MEKEKGEERLGVGKVEILLSLFQVKEPPRQWLIDSLINDFEEI